MNSGIKILQHLFPEILFNKSDNHVYLTFDDGPNPNGTENLLEILDRFKIQATFFVIGENAIKYPAHLLQIKSFGHQIGNHSFSHSSLFFKNKDFIKKQIIDTEEAIKSVIEEHTSIFRPPYGYFDLTMLKILEEMKMKCVMWNVNSKDYNSRYHNSIFKRVTKMTKAGSILLFHNNDATIETNKTILPQILDYLLSKGLTFNKLCL